MCSLHLSKPVSRFSVKRTSPNIRALCPEQLLLSLQHLIIKYLFATYFNFYSHYLNPNYFIIFQQLGHKQMHNSISVSIVRLNEFCKVMHATGPRNTPLLSIPNSPQTLFRSYDYSAHNLQFSERPFLRVDLI